jgi:formylglycine-generating enzyme required for sulfatase activity
MVKPGEWFTLEIIAVGNHLTLKVDGATAVVSLDSVFTKGHIALRTHRATLTAESTTVQFRKIEIKELPATSAPLKRGDPEYTNTLGMKFKLIPAGKFTMGSSQEEIDRCLKELKGAWLWKNLATEGPEHLVEITKPFYLGVTEVTVGQFRQFVDEQGYQVGDGRWRNPGFDQTDQHPVVWVSWNNAVDFCKWLSKKEGKEYRLPTEAEWEYSCRAGKAGSRYCFGDDDAQLENYTWFKQNSRGGTHPVGKKKPNAWGLYDMHGNASEHCQDNYDPDYYKSSPVKDPPGPSAGGARAGHGGSWKFGPVICRSAFRGYSGPDQRWDFAGFRVLLVSAAAGAGTASGAKNIAAAPAIAPFTDADVQRIAALPAAQQVQEVRKELMRRNPGFDGIVKHKIEGEVVTELRIVTDQVTDIAPIRVFDALRVLECYGTWTHSGPDDRPWSVLQPNGQLADLTPLAGMNLGALTHLSLSATKAGDAGMIYFKDCKNLTYLDLFLTEVGDAGLVPFKDCKALTELNLGATKVSDAGQANFKDCKNLKYLWLDRAPVGNAGFAQLKGIRLKRLSINNTAITDLTPLQGMPLDEIRVTPKNITRGLDLLRAMKSLKTIGIAWRQTWPPAEFWERYDNGEFK